MSKRLIQLIPVLALSLVCIGYASAGIVYVDATDGASANTVAVAGGAWSTATRSGSDNLWCKRAFANSATVFEAGGGTGGSTDDNTEDCVRLATSVAVPLNNYDVYVYIWSDGSPWRIRASLANSDGNLPLFVAGGTPLGTPLPTVAAETDFDAPVPLVTQDNRTLWQVYVGRSGITRTITVYVDDDPNHIVQNQRSWYDGIGYQALPPMIEWVNEYLDADANGVPDDQGYVDLLRAQGYTVNVRTDPNNVQYWGTLDDTKIGYLNAADLVIVSRAVNSGNYSTAPEPNQWNAVTKPMLLVSPAVTGSNRWKMLNNSTQINLVAPTMQALIPTHPIFAGIPLDPNGQVAVIDPAVAFRPVGTGAIGQTTVMGATAAGNGKLIAAVASADPTKAYLWIAEWDANATTPYYTGAAQYAGGKRLTFFSGTQQNTSATAVNPLIGQGCLNLNAMGQKLFLNAVSYLLPQTLPASMPVPPTGATGVALDAQLSWTPGDLALKHEVYFSSNKADVVSGKALIDVVTTNSYNLKPLSLVLGTTYYWKIIETNGSQRWESEVWSFTTTDYLVVDDFESYDNAGIAKAWVDAHKAAFGDRLNGHAVPTVSTAIVHAGSQAMALGFDTSQNPFVSDALRAYSTAPNWKTTAGETTLVLWFRGDPNNPAEPLTVRVNGYAVRYPGSVQDIKKASWTQWNITLSSLPINLRGIVAIDFAIGTYNQPHALHPGVIYVDDLRLYRVAP